MRRESVNICAQSAGKHSQNATSILHVFDVEKRELKEKTGRDYGEVFRNRIEAGVCMYCGDEVVEGYALCKKHLKIARESMKKPTMKHLQSGEEKSPGKGRMQN